MIGRVPPVDATYVQVHAHGTLARSGNLAQTIERFRGGLTSKVHLLTDAVGNSVRLVVTGGEPQRYHSSCGPVPTRQIGRGRL